MSQGMKDIMGNAKRVAAGKRWNGDKAISPDHQCDDMGVVEVIKGTFMLAEEMKAKEIGNAAEPADFKEVLESQRTILPLL